MLTYDNLLFPLNVLGLAKRCGARMLLASSSAVYGDPASPILLPVPMTATTAAVRRSLAGVVGKGKSPASGGGRNRRNNNNNNNNNNNKIGGTSTSNSGSSSSSSVSSGGVSLLAYEVVTVDESFQFQQSRKTTPTSSTSWLGTSPGVSHGLSAFAEGKHATRCTLTY